MLKSLSQAKLSGSSNFLKMNKLTLPASHNKSSENREVECPPMAGPCPELPFGNSDSGHSLAKIVGTLRVKMIEDEYVRKHADS